MKIMEKLKFLPKEQDNPHLPTIYDVIYGITICLATLAVVALYHTYELITTILLSCITFFLFTLWGWRRNPIRFLRAAIVMPIAEMIMVYFGVYTFSHASLFGVPLWLPVVWGIVAVSIKHKKDLTDEWIKEHER